MVVQYHSKVKGVILNGRPYNFKDQLDITARADIHGEKTSGAWQIQPLGTQQLLDRAL